MYNDLNNELFEKHFNSDERSKIWKDSIDLVSDILYFEEHMSRMKKSNFNFKVNFSEYCNERSLQILFRDYSCLGLNPPPPSKAWGGGFLFFTRRSTSDTNKT